MAFIRYDESDTGDLFCHLTNTARSAEDATFDEEKSILVICLVTALPFTSSVYSYIIKRKRNLAFISSFVKVLDDLVGYLMSKSSHSRTEAQQTVTHIRQQVHDITG